jgi:hypothetical protein
VNEVNADDELERFLSDEFFAAIYFDVVSHGYSPLTFFKRLDELYRFIETHKDLALKFPYPIQDRLGKESRQGAPESIISEAYLSHLLYHAYLSCQLFWLIKYRIEVNGLLADKNWQLCSGAAETHAAMACWEYLRHPGSLLPAPECGASFRQSKPTGQGGASSKAKLAFIKEMRDSPTRETQKAFSFLIEIGRKVYATGNFNKHLVARACGYKYGISAQGVECTGNCNGCKAIDRLIKRYNPKWNWRRDVLPLIRKTRI